MIERQTEISGGSTIERPADRKVLNLIALVLLFVLVVIASPITRADEGGLSIYLNGSEPDWSAIGRDA
ncbi:MAG TPA: hypothetical protein PKJ56_08000, partial [Promineifilum sp.]|nr:hypothetical protein [Promineifilum sp.]